MAKAPLTFQSNLPGHHEDSTSSILTKGIEGRTQMSHIQPFAKEINANSHC